MRDTDKLGDYMTDNIHHSEHIAHLVNGPRAAALTMLASAQPQEKAAERQMFTPRRFKILKIETNWRGLVPIHTLHLEDGSKIVFNPLKPGPFVLKRDRNYVRALYPNRVKLLEQYAQVLSHPRMKLLHRWLKWIFPLAFAAGLRPQAIGKVFQLDHPTFHKYYQPTETLG